MDDKGYSRGRDYSDYGNTSAMSIRRLSWGAIFAGTVAALSVQLLLTFLGISIGALVIDPAAGMEAMAGLGIGAAIWALISFVVALFCGGWIAGRMSGIGSKFDGLLEGFLVWGAVTVVSFLLLTTAIGGILGGAAGLAGNVMAAGMEQIDDPEELWREFGEPGRDVVEDPEARQEAEQAAREVGEEIAMATAASSFWAFLTLLLGAVAASFAGRMGSATSIRETTGPSHVPPKVG